ncbi:MAG: hypothetical protein VX589_11175 [Myxococcota bacterium]|nr:hypothetical protein [Myxococcota bacterium]
MHRCAAQGLSVEQGESGTATFGQNFHQTHYGHAIAMGRTHTLGEVQAFDARMLAPHPPDFCSIEAFLDCLNASEIE